MDARTSELIVRWSRRGIWVVVIGTLGWLTAWLVSPDLESLWRDCHERGGETMEYHTDTGTYDCYDAAGTRLR